MQGLINLLGIVLGIVLGLAFAMRVRQPREGVRRDGSD